MPDPKIGCTQDLNLNDKVLIFTPDGKCVDYFITEPPALLVANKRTPATAFVFGPKGQLYFPLTAFGNGNNFNEFTGGCGKPLLAHCSMTQAPVFARQRRASKVETSFEQRVGSARSRHL